MSAKSIKQSELPFVRENHPPGYKGYPFITLIQYQQKHVFTIIDNYDSKTIRAFVIDLCGPEDVSEELIVSVASDWYSTYKTKYPISFEFSKRNLTAETSKIYKSFAVESISRVIGPIFVFPMDNIIKVKRRKRREISASVTIQKVITISP